MRIRRASGPRARSTTAVLAVLGLLAAVLTALPGLQARVARAATSGVSLLPAAGQFTPLSGTPVLDTRNGTGIASPSLMPGSTLTFSVRSVGAMSTGVPADASAVVLEFNALANFAGVLSGGSAAGATDTSLTFAANTERNGFDIVTPASDGTVALAITGFSPIPSGAVMSKIVVRLHGYYSGASTTTAGSTYVGFSPTALADTTANPSGVTLNGSPTSGPLIIGTPPGGTASNVYNLQVTGNSGVPADGSATAVALQVIVQNPTCTGGFALVPAGSGRTDYDGTFTSGQNDENFDLIALPTSGQLTLRLVGCSGTATVIVRVRGYFSAPTFSTPGSSYVPQRQTIFDSANSVGTANCAATSDSPQIAAHSGCAIPVLGVGNIPSDGVSGIAAEVVAVNPAHDGWLGLYSDDNQAHTATLWYNPGGRTSNFEIATYTDVSPDGTVYVWNGGDYPVDIVVRAHGYEQAPTAAAPPLSVTATEVSAGTWSLSWTPPTADGGAAITGYIAKAMEDGTDTSVIANVSLGASTATLGGLDDTKVYLMSVAAITDASEGNRGYPAFKPGVADEGPDPGAAPTQSATPDPAPSGPAVLHGRVMLPSGSPASGFSVTIRPLPGPDATGGTVTPLGIATTGSDGRWSFTLPQLSPDLQAQADDNGGVLNVEAVAQGQVTGTSLTTVADVGIAAGVGNTEDAAQARANNAAAPAVSTLYVTDPRLAGDVTGPFGLDDGGTGTSTAASADGGMQGLESTTATADQFDGWQSPDGTVAAGYNPMVVNNVDYTSYPQSHPNCSAGTEETRDLDPVYTTKYTNVGEAHAYWDTTASFIYTRTADSDVSSGYSLNGTNFSISGSLHVGNTVSGRVRTNWHGPYWGRIARVPIQYVKKVSQWRCYNSDPWKTLDVVVYPVRYHIPDGWAVGKLGADVSFRDGYSYWSKAPYHSKVPATWGWDLTSGTTVGYKIAVTVFGFGPTVLSDYSGSRTQSINAGDDTSARHDLFAWHSFDKDTRVFYSW
jgi:Fibronectin type III domain